MKKRRHRFLCAILLLLLRPALPNAQAQEAEVIAGGEIEYQAHCAVCHGADGKGDGTLASYLKVKPADLRQLSLKNQGEFPFWRMYGVIDGREEIAGHGSRTMPIWGSVFQGEAKGAGIEARTIVAGRILGLVFYLRSIQLR